MKEIVSTSNLTRRYKKYTAVDGVNICIREGEIYGLIGKNGAGKSTLLKMIAGLTFPTEGTIRTIDKTKIGALIENPALYLNLTAYENLKLKCIALGIHDYHCIKEALELTGLSDDRKKVKNYSLGMKQRLGIAMALIGDPGLIILDEPINGLDPQGIQEIRNIILGLNKEKKITFIVSSHILEELAKLATNFGFINRGKLLAELSVQELKDQCETRLEVSADDVCGAGEALEDMGITKYRLYPEAGKLCIYECIEKSAEINESLMQRGVRVTGFSSVKQSLEEFYFRLLEEN